MSEQQPAPAKDEAVSTNFLEDSKLTGDQQLAMLPSIIDALKNAQGSHRDEILRNVETRRNITLTNLTIAGLFLSAGLANFANTGFICLAYCVIAYYLALEWRRDDNKIADNRRFIREYVEQPLSKILNMMSRNTGQQVIVLWEMQRFALHEIEKLIPKHVNVDEVFKVPAIYDHAASMLGLVDGQEIPPAFITEVKARISRNRRSGAQVESGARGIFNVLQILTTLLGSWSLFLNIMLTLSILQRIAYATVGIMFVVINIILIFKTREILRHERS